MRTLQRLRDVAIGYCLSNRRSLIALTALLMALPIGLLSPAAVAIGGMVLGLGQYSNILTVQTAAGTLFNTYTTAKSVINATNLVQLPPNYLYVGKKLRVTVRGAVSNIVTTPGTITFQIMMGSIVAWSSGAIQLNATAHTLLPFTLVVDLRCDTIGAGTAAKFMGLGPAERHHVHDHGGAGGRRQQRDRAAGAAHRARGRHRLRLHDRQHPRLLDRLLDLERRQRHPGAGLHGRGAELGYAEHARRAC
jgi:hypothetical protein